MTGVSHRWRRPWRSWSRNHYSAAAGISGWPGAVINELGKLGRDERIPFELDSIGALHGSEGAPFVRNEVRVQIGTGEETHVQEKNHRENTFSFHTMIRLEAGRGIVRAESGVCKRFVTKRSRRG